MADKERKLVARSDVKSFYGVKSTGTTPTFTRMRGFTELSESKNPIEYSRQYVDEKHETTDVVGYSPSVSFAFDRYTGDDVLTDIAALIDDEVVGSAAHREIVQVDFSDALEDGFTAKKRTFSIVGDSVGDSTEAMTYSGTMQPVGGVVDGVAKIGTPEDGNSDNVLTITFEEV